MCHMPCIYPCENDSLRPGIFYFLLIIVSNRNIMKTLTPLVHDGLFGCFHNPPKSGMDCRIFNVCMWSFLHAYCIHTGDLGSEGIFIVCAEFDSGEISGQVQSLLHTGHPSILWPRSIVLNLDFRVRVLLSGATDSAGMTAVPPVTGTTSTVAHRFLDIQSRITSLLNASRSSVLRYVRRDHKDY